MPYMPERENNEGASRRADRSGDDPFERLRKYLDEVRPEWEASRERSKRALAEMDAALKLRSR
jgi:hypothetical protein